MVIDGKRQLEENSFRWEDWGRFAELMALADAEDAACKIIWL